VFSSQVINPCVLTGADQQIGQLYELMQAIQKQSQDDADAEEAEIVNALDNHKPKPDQ
jgi:hypothetical protein